MRNYLVCSLMLVLVCLSGCSVERYFTGNGAEALVYEEWHSFDIDLRGHPDQQQVLERLIEQIQQQDPYAQYTVLYKNNKNKQVFYSASKGFIELSKINERVNYIYSPENIVDLTIRAKVLAAYTETCQAVRIFKETGQINCFVESARVKQIANKQRLVGGQ
ncbi:hypothetical protein JCM19232_620 [Vibrio ishigakensis]|uniref:Uncharacterized protein n=1 Tax=Vibrio ishigakensis TaxID=1481914 RepID=A0A0B8P6V5_9VIBR|nr:hypothetical protein JCM19232_620 [Vibrio ishigakensis]